MVNVEKLVQEIFTNVQFNKTSHHSYLKKMKKLYSKVEIDEFTEAFVDCLKVALSVGERHPRVENTLEFAAQFSVGLFPPKSDASPEATCPFLVRLFDFILAHHAANDQAVRFRLCYFLNALLNLMGENAFLEDRLCDKITSSMIDRLMDKSPKVRAQAVLALHRLQDPTDEDCPVIKMYVYHLSKDPNSEVRKAVLSSMAKNQKALLAVLRRTRDIDDGVRKMAYEFISKITVKSLTIGQRECLLNDGLNDKSERVRASVTNVLLPTWLLHYQENYLRLLRALDVEREAATVAFALDALFKRDSVEKLLQQLPVDSETKLIPLDKLTCESALYWRYLVEHLNRESCAEYVEQCLPELTKFCLYVDEFVKLVEGKEDDSPDQLASLQFILHELLKITESYDLADEIGRANLRRLVLETLPRNLCTEKITESLVGYFEKVVPNVETRLNCLVELINEIRNAAPQAVSLRISERDECERKLKRARLAVKLNEIQEEEYEAIRKRDFLTAQVFKEQIEILSKEIEEMSEVVETDVDTEGFREEKNPAEILVKCLSIMCVAIAPKSVTRLTAGLRSLYENLVLPSIDHETTSVHVLALKAVALCCLLDRELAKAHIMTFFIQFSSDEEIRGVWLISLQAILDLFLYYGLEFFGIARDDESENSATTAANNKSRKSGGHVRLFSDTGDETSGASLRSDDGTTKFVKILVGLLDNEDQQLRTIATEGLCKLLLHGRISGGHLISRLVILMHNPVTKEDVYLRQCLCNFFKNFVRCVAESEGMLEDAFVPTLKTLANAPDTSPLRAITPHHVAQFILGLTSSLNHEPGNESYTVHNNLAFAIIAEALDPRSEIDLDSLVNSLRYLDVRFDDDAQRNDLREAADKIEETLRVCHKRLLRYVQQFKAKFLGVAATNEPEASQRPTVAAESELSA